MTNPPKPDRAITIVFIHILVDFDDGSINERSGTSVAANFEWIYEK